MTITEIIASLTLLVTIIGWFMTYRYQRIILEKQIKAENDRLAREWIIPKRINRLEELRKWIFIGQRLFFSLETEKQIVTKRNGKYYYETIDESEGISKIIIKLKEWMSESWSFITWVQSEGFSELNTNLGIFVTLMEKVIDTNGQEGTLELWEEGDNYISIILTEIDKLIKVETLPNK